MRARLREWLYSRLNSSNFHEEYKKACQDMLNEINKDMDDYIKGLEKQYGR